MLADSLTHSAFIKCILLTIVGRRNVDIKSKLRLPIKHQATSARTFVVKFGLMNE